MPMGITAENLGEKYKITRQECDEYALKSQHRWRLGLFLIYLIIGIKKNFFSKQCGIF
jgi:hypothetical protein